MSREPMATDRADCSPEFFCCSGLGGAAEQRERLGERETNDIGDAAVDFLDECPGGTLDAIGAGFIRAQRT